LFEPLKQQLLAREELTALELLCTTERQSVFVSDRAVIRKEVFHSLIYKRGGNSCSNIVEVEDTGRRMECYGRVKIFVHSRPCSCKSE
jgi:hypothetical protein